MADSARMAGGIDGVIENEADRLRAVRNLGILDTSSERSYDRIVDIVRKVFSVDIAAISILDGHRLWLKSSTGTDVAEADRRDTFSQFTIDHDTPFVITDARSDARFSDNPYVDGPPYVRSYAGVPIKSANGHNVGAICAVDTKPRNFGTRHLDLLQDLSGIVGNLLSLRERAMTDELTGALTRRAFREQSGRLAALAIRHRHNLATVCFDLDHFKSINDTYGHAAGDEVLQSVCRAVELRVRRSDVFARVGGEEFALLLPETDRNGALEVAEKIRKDIRALRFEFDGKTVGVTSSFGVAVFKPASEDFNTFMRRADAALYQAKSEGRNRCIAFGNSEVTVKASRRRVLKAGKISFNNGGSSIDCTVRTLGEEGAGMDLISTADVPDAFRLLIRSDGFDASCKVTSRTRTHLEVEFR